MSDSVYNQESCGSEVHNSNPSINNKTKKSNSSCYNMKYINDLENKMLVKVKLDYPFQDKSSKSCKDKDKSARPLKGKRNGKNASPLEQPDQLLQELDEYCRKLLPNLTNTATLKSLPEVLELVKDPVVMDNEKRPFVCPQTDLDKLIALTDEVKNLRVPSSWG